MLEVWIVAMCIGDFKCNELAQAYVKTEKGSQYVRTAKKDLYRYTDKELVATIGTMVAAAANKKIEVRIAKGFTVTGNYEDFMFGYKFNF